MHRTAVAATVLAGAGLALTACQGASGGAAAAAPAATVTVTAAPIATSEPGTPTSTPTVTATPKATPTKAPGATPTPSAPARCAVESLNVSDAHPVEPTHADGTYDLDVKLTNLGTHSCTLKGFPTVAMAGNGDPSHSKPLKAVPVGTAHTVLLHPGSTAYLRLNLRQVLGEADGYCASGATPAAPPTLVLGVGKGAAQIALEGGGYFAECDDVVRTTAFLAARP